MLIIRRKSGESLLIGDGVEVEVLAVEGGQVKLGIRAPREIVVLRKEVRWARTMNRAAARTKLPGGLDTVLGRLRVVNTEVGSEPLFSQPASSISGQPK